MIRWGVHPSAVVDNQGELVLPESTVLEPQTVLYIGPRGRVRLGERNTFYPQVSVRVDQGWVTTGNDVSFGSGCHIYEPRAGLEIGDDVLIAGGCFFCGVSHGHGRLDMAMRYQAAEVGKICIESDVWLGMGVIVLPGVTIGRGSIIGAGSVVTRDVPPGSVAWGTPCKVQRKREDAQS